MTSLIRVEWLKMRKYNAFWWILGITALSYPGINAIFYFGYKEMTSQPNQASQLAKMAIGNPFSFPEVWQTVAYLTSFFVFIPAVMIIMFITNEYTFKTHRQNIIDGWSRRQFITSKLIDVLIVSIIITVLYFIVAIVAGVVNQERIIQDTWGEAQYIGLFALQTFAQLSVAFLVGFLVRKAFIALGIFIFYFIILENLLIVLFEKLHTNIGHYLPLEISDRIIPYPHFMRRLDSKEHVQQLLSEIPLYIGLTIGLTAFIWFICYWLNDRRDLK